MVAEEDAEEQSMAESAEIPWPLALTLHHLLSLQQKHRRYDHLGRNHKGAIKAIGGLETQGKITGIRDIYPVEERQREAS